MRAGQRNVIDINAKSSSCVTEWSANTPRTIPLMFFHGTTLGDKCRNAVSAKLTAPGSCVPSVLTSSRKVSHPRNRSITLVNRDSIVVTHLAEKYVRDACKGAMQAKEG